MAELKMPGREAFETWYDTQPYGRLEPFDVWTAAIAHAVRSGHACTYALDDGGNLYRRYREPQCPAGVDASDEALLRQALTALESVRMQNMGPLIHPAKEAIKARLAAGVPTTDGAKR